MTSLIVASNNTLAGSKVAIFVVLTQFIASTAFWMVRGHRVLPFSPPVLTSKFNAKRVQLSRDSPEVVPDITSGDNSL